jgi:hypothetical protein
MGIRAILRKNTASIRERIIALGLSCTTSTTDDLIYVENSKAVTWWAGECTDPTCWDCKDDEDLFFYLISLKTNIQDVQHLESMASFYKKEFEKYHEKYLTMTDVLWRTEVERDNLRVKLDTILCKLANHDLEKQVEELTKKIEELTK